MALLCIAYVVWVSRFDIATLWKGADRLSLLIACAFLGAANCLSPLASRKILQSLGIEVSYLLLLRIHMCRLPARYLPGGVWHTVGRAVDLNEHGVSRTAIAWMVSQENLLAISMAFLLGSVILLLSGTQTYLYRYLIALFVAAAVAILVTFPLLARKLWPEAMPNMTIRAWTNCCVWYAVIWASHAAAFVAYSIALIGGCDSSQMLQTAGVYLFSWAVGLLAFFAPQGIGIFEVTATTLAGQTLLPANIAVVAGFRLCMLIVDLCLGLGGRLQNQK